MGSFEEEATESTEFELFESEAVSEAGSGADEFDEEQFTEELDSALNLVRDLAASQQDGFVNALCDLISAQSEQEPTTAELYGVLGAIKQSLAEEALEESDSVEAESDYESTEESDTASEEESEQDYSEQDSYDPEEDSFDYAVDVEDDIESELQDGTDTDSGVECEDEVDSADFSERSSIEVDAKSEIELESTEDSEHYSVELSERDSYNPSDDSFDYAVDAEDSMAFASSASESATESEYECESADLISSASASASASESEAESVSEEVSHNLERESVDLGDTAQESLVNRICELYAEENGEEATTNDVRDIFAQVKRMFAEEAEQEQYHETDEDESEDEEQEEDSFDSEEDSFDYAVDSEDDIECLAS